MPQINVNGELREVSQAEYDALTTNGQASTPAAGSYEQYAAARAKEQAVNKLADADANFETGTNVSPEFQQELANIRTSADSAAGDNAAAYAERFAQEQQDLYANGSTNLQALREELLAPAPTTAPGTVGVDISQQQGTDGEVIGTLNTASPGPDQAIGSIVSEPVDASPAEVNPTVNPQANLPADIANAPDPTVAAYFQTKAELEAFQKITAQEEGDRTTFVANPEERAAFVSRLEQQTQQLEQELEQKGLLTAVQQAEQQDRVEQTAAQPPIGSLAELYPDDEPTTVPLAEIEIQPAEVSPNQNPQVGFFDNVGDDIEVPQETGISPYGEQDDPFDPTTIREPDPALFTEEYVQNQDNPVEFPQEQDTGVSPYGEADEPFDPNFVSQPDPALFTEEYVQNQDNPVEFPQEQDTGISPYGEENEPPDLVPLIDPFEVDGDPGYGSAETEFAQDNPNLVTLEVPDPYEIDGANIGLTEEEIQEQDNPAAARQSDTLNRARAQAILQQQRKQANDGDWRVRLRLAPSAQYLYKSDSPGILQPLAVTDGVVFPYTPQITTSYKASYNSYNLTHSNYRGFFYQGSQVEDIQINAVFTAQDTAEANYLLAVIHFFRSVTKMFYGQDAQRGSPPPLVFLQGLGEYQFNLAPCVVSQFNYNLPPDVDYIRAGSPNINGTNLLQRRSRQDLPTNPFTSAWSRIENILKPQNIKKGAIPAPPAPPTLGTNRPTYVPTKIEISLILHPMQSREQVSKQFSLRQYANGDLLKGGFW